MKWKVKKCLALFALAALLLAVQPASAFAAVPTDITNHWAKAQITDWVEKGFIKGYPDGSFKPDKNVSRAEFMALVNRAFGYSQKADINYEGVPDGTWFYDTVAKAKAAGYIRSYEDGSIRPDNPITRAEAATIIMRVKGLAADPDAAAKFADTASIPAWSKGAVGAATKAGIMSGYPDGSFKAQSFITRAEAVVALNKALSSTEAMTVTYDKAGIYGPAEGTATVKSSVIIKTEGLTLQNTIIEGDLTIDKAVGEGNVTLKNVTVEGTAYINGGGTNSVHLIDTILKKAVVQKANGTVRLVASGNAELGQLVVQSSIKVEETNLSGKGFTDVVVEKKVEGMIVVNLVGAKVESIKVKNQEVTLSADKNTEIKTLEVKADNVTVTTEKGTTITTLVADGKVSVTGQGTIQKAEVNVSGASFETKPQNQAVAAGVIPPTVSTGTTGGSSGGGGGSGTPATVTAASLGKVSARMSIGSVKINFEFYRDAAGSQPLNYAEVLQAPFYLDPVRSTVQLARLEGGNAAKSSEKVSLQDLLGSLNPSEEASFQDMNETRDVFGFEDEDWMPNTIVLNLSSKTAVDGKQVANPWSMEDVQVPIGEEFFQAAVAADGQMLTVNDFETFRPLTLPQDLENIRKDLLLLAEGWMGSAITWSSSEPSVVCVSPVPIDINMAGYQVSCYTGRVTRLSTDTDVTLTASLNLEGKTVQKQFNLTVLAADTNPPAVTKMTAMGDNINIEFDEALNRDRVPAANTFTVSINGTNYSATAIQLPSYASYALSLTIPAAVLCGDTVTVSFNSGPGPAISDLDGNELSSFGPTQIPSENILTGSAELVLPLGVVELAEAHTNVGVLDPGNIDVDIRNGVFASDIGDNDIAWSSNLPAGLGYTVVRKGDTSLTVMITGSAFSHLSSDSIGEGAGLKFTIPKEKIRGAEGPLEVGPVTITFYDDQTPPELLQIITDDGNLVLLNYDEELDENSIPDKDDFTVTLNGNTATVSQVTIANGGGWYQVQLTLVDNLYFGDTVIVSYTPGSKPIKNTSRLAAAGFSDVTASGDMVSSADRYLTEPTVLAETTNNNGTVTPDKITVTIVRGIFASDFGAQPGDVTAYNLPQGLSYSVTRTSDTKITITITGAATNHRSADSVNDVYFVLNPARIRGGDPQYPSLLRTNNISINFND